MLDRALASDEPFDFVSEISRELPIRFLCSIFTVPQEDAPDLIEWGDQMIANQDPDLSAAVVGREDTEEYRLLPFRSPTARKVFAYADRQRDLRLADPADDVIAATRGVEYLFGSTDEVYYAGICAKCERPYSPVNRSLAWVDFVRKAHEHLTKRGRKMLVWAEFPLLPEHVKLLPSGIIDGEATYPQAEVERGIRELAYRAMQGGELLFPDHFSMDGHKGHLDQAFEIASTGKHWQGNPIGSFGAAWDDSGLHNETFWLGWSAAARYGWNRGAPAIDQHIAEFMRVYYGPGSTGMAEVYRAMQRQARAWEKTWERVPSKVILTRYGSYFGKGIGTHRTDMTLSLPLLNDLPDWFPDPFWTDRYKDWIAEARLRAAENEQLVAALLSQMGQVSRNHYNLEVLLSLARFMGHHWRFSWISPGPRNRSSRGRVWRSKVMRTRR